VKEVTRITVNVVAAVLIATTLAGCGKKTAPVPPEDVPPGKQERSSSDSYGDVVHAMQIDDEVTRCSS
jgi:predicted small lipoprotein YifL